MSRRVFDYVEEAGSAALGGRLRRLSERVDGEARRIYAEQGIAFEQRWLGLLDLLSAGPKSVGELAQALGISHPSVSESRRSLASAGLIDWQVDERDRRRKLLRLSPAGEDLVGRLRPLWSLLDDVAREVDVEAGGVTASLARLEAALDRRPFSERVLERLRGASAEREGSE